MVHIMNSLIREEFNTKQGDLDAIIELTKFCDRSNQITVTDPITNDNLILDENIVDILKSVIHVMSYNQVESTLRGCVEEVYDHLSDNNVGYDKLLNCMQKEILDAVVKNKENIYGSVGNDLNLKIPKASLRIRKVFNGNVTKKTFSTIQNNYGIRIAPSEENKDGEGLNVLKNARNNLSHGNISFSKHGRADSLDSFLSTSKSVSSYMLATINAFERYIEQKNYLSPS